MTLSPTKLIGCLQPSHSNDTLVTRTNTPQDMSSSGLRTKARQARKTRSTAASSMSKWYSLCAVSLDVTLNYDVSSPHSLHHHILRVHDDGYIFPTLILGKHARFDARTGYQPVVILAKRVSLCAPLLDMLLSCNTRRKLKA
jgi:hypothetical protein